MKHDLWVIADEIYARILFNGEYKSIYAMAGMKERTIIIDGFSKSFAMTGWRLGYAVAPKEFIDALGLLVLNTFTCTAEFSQVAAIEALNDSTNAVDAMVLEYQKRRDLFVNRLNQIPGFRCLSPDGAFYAWVNIEDTGLPAEEVQRLLLEEVGVAGIAGAAFGPAGKNYLRFSLVSARHLLEEALERIERVLDNAGGWWSRDKPSKGHGHSSKSFEFAGQSSPEPTRMKHLLHFTLLLAACFFVAANAGAQARPLPGPDVQKIYDRLLPQIEKIPLYDNHAHPGFGDDSDVDAMAAVPGETDFMRTRADNPEFITAAKQMLGYPYNDFSPEHMKWLADKSKAAEAAGDTKYFDSILDKLNTDTVLANRALMAPYLDPKRFHCPFFRRFVFLSVRQQRANGEHARHGRLHPASGKDAVALQEIRRRRGPPRRSRRL